MAAWRPRNLCVKILGTVLVALLALPIVVLIGVSLNAGVEQVFPRRGLSLRWYANLANRQGFIEAAQLTLALAVGSSIVSVVVSLCAAVAITREDFFGRDLVLTLLLSPLIVPQVVVGMAFLVTLSALGIFSSVLSLSLLHCIITLPFTVRVVVAALQAVPRSLEEAAQSLGASPLRAFIGVTVPQAAPGLVAGAIFAFVTSFENFTASQFLVWDHVTLPVAIYTSVQTENDPTAAALSTLIVLAVIAGITVFNRFIVQHMFAGKLA
jgi:putative spermidine/putrescine transport system permease protein